AEPGTACDEQVVMAAVERLLDEDVSLDVRDPRGSVTPLLLLLGARAEPGTACDEQVVMAAVERLLDEDVSLDVRDPRG
ncbi:hypothetical protein C7E13_21980, partial [Stenotrophomonas maltophilia]